MRLTRLDVALRSFIKIGDEESGVVPFLDNNEGDL